MRTWLCVALALLPLAPGALAAAAPVGGAVTFGSDALLAGAARFEAAEGALDLSGPLSRGAPVSLSWASARGHLVSTEWTVAFDPTGDHHDYMSGVDPRPVAMANGTLVGVECAGTCQVLVLAEPGDAGRLALVGDAQGAFRWLREERVYWAAWQRDWAFLRKYDVGTLLAGGEGTPLAGARAEATGQVGLFFENATLLVQTDAGTVQRLDATTRRSMVAGVPGGARVEEVTGRFGFLALEDARLLVGPDESALLLAPRLRVTLPGGTLQAERAEGRVSYMGRDIRLAGGPLEVAGDLALEVETRIPTDTPTHLLLRGASSLDAAFHGEATSVRAGGTLVTPPTPLLPAASTTGAALGLALLASLPWWLPRLVLPLYSRIHKGSVLQSPNRALLHRLIGDEPGRTPAELARRLGLARVVVRHHLRMLEAHGLVACHADGRKRRYFLPDTPGRADPALHALLEDGLRRQVAEVLAASPAPLTQQEIALRIGCSPRLVSYHLARLVALGIVRRQGSRPSSYALQAPPRAGPREADGASG